MPGFLQMSYHCLCYIYDCFRSTWPVSLVYGHKPLKPSPDTKSRVLYVTQQLRRDEELESTNTDILRSIEMLPFTEDVLAIKDGTHSLNLLQHAIVLNKKEIACLIINKAYIPSSVACNHPLHLAASLGRTYILQNLLEKRPRDLNKRCGLCYPDQHEPVDYHRRFGFMFQPSFRCEIDKFLPMEYAILGDHLECVQLIGNSLVTQNRGYTLSGYLHFASRHGAEKCMQHFIQKYPDQINESDSNGDVPLLLAVVWGRKCSKLLIDNGADVNMVAENGDTALHRLYRNDIDGIFAIHDTTRYLLTTGIEQLINTVNLKGETALHLLTTHVSYIGGNFYHMSQREVPRWQLQPNYQEQVIQTLKLLLDFNADPHIFDLNGLQPLNKLLHVTLKASQPDNPLECVQASINSIYIYRNDFKSLGRAIDVLVQNGSDVNTRCAIGHTPLILLVQALLNTEIPDLVQQSSAIFDAVDILLHNGANCNFVSDDQSTFSTMLARLAQRILVSMPSSAMTEESKDIKSQFALFINELLVRFLKHGLNPNFTSTKKSGHLAGGTGNALIEFVRLSVYASDALDFQMLHTWLRTLLKWGADPDLEPYQSDPIICHSQSSIFLKKQGTQALSHYIHEVKELQAILDNGSAEELLLLFYKTMDHKILFECLTTACFMARFHPLGATGQSFLAILNSMTDTPRSLKQIARVSIYKSLDRKLATRVDSLPLPKSLKTYLLEIE